MQSIPSILILAGLGGLASAEVVDGNKGELVQRDQAQAAPAHEINPAFAGTLYQQLRGEQGNVFFSPYSISQAMGMAYEGAREETATEIAAAMDFGKEQDSFGGRMEHLRRMLGSFVNQNGDQLRIANALCVTGVAPDKPYLAKIRNQYDAEAFSGRLEEINGWVAEKTEGHIEKILERLAPNSACVLLNAVYFKGNWQHPFKGGKSHDGIFHVRADKEVDVKYMVQRNRFAHVRNERWIAVELPYQSSASMVLLMPAQADGMEELEASLSKTMLGQLDEQLHAGRNDPGVIELRMPKFKVATEYDLIPAMKQLGVKSAFDETANFSGMYENISVYISQIKHKATLEVDELGSVASAATAVEISRKSAPMPAPRFVFDRPFLVLIRENKTQSTLFLGRISNPAGE